MSHEPDLTAVNTTDFAPVCIYFTDEVINELFAELLAVRGVEARIVHSVEAVPGNARIITEPHLFPALAPTQRSRCLVVGDRTAVAGLHAFALTRPLTEEKIETALGQLLGATANPA
jgi:hypothetical protein